MIFNYFTPAANLSARVFADCSSLKQINLPSTLTSLGEGAFRNSSIKALEIPESQISIADSLFYSCDSLELVKFSSNTKSVGVAAFAYCTTLTSLKLPELIKSIPQLLFAGCKSLETVTIPANVTTVYQGNSSNNVFYNCTSLKEIIMLPITPPYNSYSSSTTATNFLSNTNSSVQIKVPAESLEAYKTSTFWKPLASYIVALETE